jgi:ABC-type antimicrobial peptide transport system permease subunit
MDLEKPIGKIIKTGNSECQIIGVVKDFQYGSMHQAIEPLIFRFRNAGQAANVIVKIKAGSDQEVIKQIGNYYKKFHPKYLFEYSFLDADYNALYKSEEKVGKLSNLFSLLAIFISCLGLFGLATFTAQKRRKEIGIRKVLGASVFSISILLSKDFIKLVVIAIIIATPVAWWAMNEWLQEFAYRVTISWWMFALTGLIAIAIALCTVSFQAIKAAIANPVKSLRTE